MEGTETTTSDSMVERLKRDAAAETIAGTPPGSHKEFGEREETSEGTPIKQQPVKMAAAAEEKEDSEEEDEEDKSLPPPALPLPALLGHRTSLRVSGEALLGFLGFKRKSSAGGTVSPTTTSPTHAREAPKRLIVGHVLVARQRNEFVQRSLKQDGKLVLVTRLNMNKVDFVVDLALVTMVESRTEIVDGAELHSVAVAFGRELVLISAGSQSDTDDFRALLVSWVRHYAANVVESPRGSPRRGQLRGYLLRVSGKTFERLWATQMSGDTLSLFLARGKDPIASIDMQACARCQFDRVLLQFTLYEGKESHVFRCETDDNYVYWRAGILKYSVEQKILPKKQTIELNYEK